MNSRTKAICVALGGMFFFVCSAAFFQTFITLKLAEKGVAGILIGLLHSAFSAGYLVGSLRATYLIQTVGSINSLNIFSNIFAVMLMAQGITENIGIWLIFRFIAGLAAAMVFIIIEGWMIEQGDNRGKMLSLYMIALYASQAVGQLLVHWVNPNSLVPFLISGSLSALSIIPVALGQMKENKTVEAVAKKSLAELMRCAPLGLWGCFVGGTIIGAIQAFAPAALLSQKLPAAEIMALTTFGGFLLQWPIGYLSDIYERSSIILVASAAVSVPCLIILAAHGSWIWISVASFLIGGCGFAIYPLSIAELCERLPKRYTTHAISVCSLFYGMGLICGPLGSALLIQITTPLLLYAFVGLASTSLAVIAANSYNKMQKQKNYKPLYLPTQKGDEDSIFCIAINEIRQHLEA